MYRAVDLSSPSLFFHQENEPDRAGSRKYFFSSQNKRIITGVVFLEPDDGSGDG
jgi:hypothetical protein